MAAWCGITKSNYYDEWWQALLFTTMGFRRPSIFIHICIYFLQKETTKILRGTKYDCKRDRLWVRTPFEVIKKNISYFHFFAQCCGKSVALSSAARELKLPLLPCYILDTTWTCMFYKKKRTPLKRQ